MFFGFSTARKLGEIAGAVTAVSPLFRQGLIVRVVEHGARIGEDTPSFYLSFGYFGTCGVSLGKVQVQH